ncbi:alpha/beta fold hydrolase [Conexibacter sp. SYSU D00693]|uniref:alpha/beta fold hydrolase n=1 Tax=Conexibacter sp. SYSU D00693 TaxID=2812560 RepID=UPI00196B3E94|nr:alpha/beta fold hydrolase [Conexibacter sp. SYSU D00693]
MRTRSHPRLYVTDAGDGEPVLVVTGWTISSAIFDELGERLVDAGVRVIAYDHRGTGRSASWLGPVSIASLAADAARVLDEREVESAHVVGLSLGAAIALELAVRMPARVRSLCLVGGTAGGPSMTLPGPGPAGRALAALGRDSLRRLGLWPAALLFSDEFRREHPERVKELTEPFIRHRPPPWAIGWQTLAASCFSRAASLGDVSAPTLLLHGGADVMVPPRNAKVMARALPDAELHVVPGAGHAVVFERPDETVDLMLDFFARHATRVPPAADRRDVVVERLTRPFALHAGAARNTLQLVGVGRPRRRPPP